METIELLGQTPSRKAIEAVFTPEKGMNLLSLKIGEWQLIDQSTLELFEERGAGLGAIIGPHFHHRTNPPPVKDITLFPHLKLMKERGIAEPFSHGIGRYVPWKVTARERGYLRAEINGEMNWRGVTYKELEGFNFRMIFEARIVEWGLWINLQLSGDRPSVCGLHYYYKRGTEVTSKVQPACRTPAGIKPVPPLFHYNNNEMAYRFEEPCDHGFFPHPDARMGWIDHHFEKSKVHVRYVTPGPASWQLWHPKDASFVCIEPLSAVDPRSPQKRVNGLSACIEIEE